LKISLVPSAFYPSVGGVEELVRQLALEQHRRGWPTLIVANRWPRGLPAVEQIDGLTVRRYPFRVGGGGMKRNLAAAVFGPATTAAFCHDLRAAGVELIHLQCVSCTAPYVMQAARRLGLPLVASLQGELTMDADQVFQRKESDRRMYRDLLAAADAVTACSKQTLREAVEFFGSGLEAKSRVIYNGVRLEDFASPYPYVASRPYILAIGRHVPQKGLDVLLRAYTIAKPAGHDLLIAGDGPQTLELKSLAAELGIGSNVQFLGAVSHDKAVSLFAGCSFFVLPSRHEPMGIVNLEAMAAGKAVVASRVGGVPELVVDGQTGMLVDADNPTALAAALGSVSADPELRRRLGAAGRERVALFSWPALADQYESVYRQVMQERNQP
jgi:glycosyltransferase involved in cell wall biosynthesis